MAAKKLLFAGLGNPGKKYEMTRHNVGFMVVEELVRRTGESFRMGKGSYEIASNLRFSGVDAEITCIKPLTYMNRSGHAIREAMQYFKFETSELLVVVDEFQLPFGHIRFRPRGSAGGHNGLASIIQALNTDEFHRLRLGIGNERMSSWVDFVLSRFNREESDQLPATIARAADAALDFAQKGIERAMNEYNSKTS